MASLQTRITRRNGDKTYVKHELVIPQEYVQQLGWAQNQNVEALKGGLARFFSEILRNEIDPAANKFKGWTALIPWSTSPDTPLARKLIVEDEKKASLTLEPLIEMGPLRSLHALYDVIPMAKVKGRQFKWALAYPTRRIRELNPRSMRWLHGWHGRYYMISDHKRSLLLRAAFDLTKRSN